MLTANYRLRYYTLRFLALANAMAAGSAYNHQSYWMVVFFGVAWSLFDSGAMVAYDKYRGHA